MWVSKVKFVLQIHAAGGNGDLTQGDAAVVGRHQAMSENLQAPLGQASIYHFAQKAILKCAPGEDYLLKAVLRRDAGAGFDCGLGHAAVKAPGDCGYRNPGGKVGENPGEQGGKVQLQTRLRMPSGTSDHAEIAGI